MTMLEQIEDRRVFDVMVSTDKKKIKLQECCDGCFFIELTKYEMSLLIHELQDIRNRMEE